MKLDTIRKRLTNDSKFADCVNDASKDREYWGSMILTYDDFLNAVSEWIYMNRVVGLRKHNAQFFDKHFDYCMPVDGWEYRYNIDFKHINVDWDCEEWEDDPTFLATYIGYKRDDCDFYVNIDLDYFDEFLLM